MFLVPFYGDGDLKKSVIHACISKHNTYDLHDLYFPEGVLNTNEDSKCEGQKQY